ncbi:MAG: hypothetical protein H8E85_00730 [Candidatus Marinimicrobia bacterium]|nr:hypothetical protein [Candidatus Neomarinimicrobiota bacterium]
MIPVLEFIKNRKSFIKIAHRGGLGIFPENTLTAFHGSVDEFNIEMIELDLQITKDRKVIVLHDETVDRTTNGTGGSIDLSYKEISEFDAGHNFQDNNGKFPFRDKGVKIPLFEDVIKQFPDTYFNIELKGNNKVLAAETSSIVKRHNLENKILIGSANYFQNRRVHKYLPDYIHYLSQPDIYLFSLIGRLGISRKYWEKFHVIEVPLNYHNIHVYPILKKGADNLNKPLFVWDANDKQTIQKLNSDGVSGIMTDYPNLF